MIPTLAALSPFVVTALVVVFLLVCIAMILLILIQRPQGGGLSGAFGAGGGAGQTAFGTKTGDVLTIVTIAIFVLFLGMAVILNFAARPSTAPAPGVTAVPIGSEVPDEAPDEGDAESGSAAGDDAGTADAEVDDGSGGLQAEPEADPVIEPEGGNTGSTPSDPESDGGTP